MKKLITLISIVFFLGLSTKSEAQCTVDFQYSTTCNDVQFYDSSFSKGITHSYFWNFGDGTSSTAQHPKHSYNKTGTYTVKHIVTAYDSLRKVLCVDSAVHTISISSKCCKADFSYQVNGLDVYFSNNSTSGTTAHWSFGDGTTTGTNPHTYSKAGTYTVCLVINDSAKSCLDTICKSVTVIAKSCKASFTWTQPDSTKSVIKFTNTSKPSNGTVYWSFGDGTSGTGDTITHTYNTSGVLNVCITVVDSSRNCTDRFCKTVTILGGSCKADFGYANRGSKRIYFSNKSTLYKTYSWNFGDGKTSNQAHPLHQYAKAGTYTVCLYVTDSLSSCTDSICKTVTVDTLQCEAKFRAIADSSTKFKILIINQSKGTNLSYYWDFGDSSTSTSKNPKHKYKRSGKYQLCLTITDRNCTSTYCDTIGMDSTGKMLKAEGFDIEVIDEGSSSSRTITLTQAKTYPNPFSGELLLKLQDGSGAIEMVELLDTRGLRISVPVHYISTSSAKLNTSNIPTGMYLLRFKSDGVQQTKRIIKVD
jgi:PKD repeat protein